MSSDRSPQSPRRRASKTPEDSAPPNPPPFAPFALVRSERIYSSRWCGLRRDFLRLGDGSLQEYHVVEITDAVAVVPVLDDGSIVLIGQYRYPHGKTHWEIPAGRISADESPLECAARELEEETGYRSLDITSLPGFYPINGISAHYAHAFVAKSCVRDGTAQPEACEQILVQRFTREEVRALLRSGRIQDGFSLIPLAYHLGF